MSNTAYATVEYANEYFMLRAFSSAWEKAGDEKSKLLNFATELIKEYCTFEDELNGGFFVYDEVEEGREWLKDATCEQALYLANLGKDPTQADKKTTLGIASTEGTVFDKSFAADIIGTRCRRILEAHGGILTDGASTAGSGGIGSGSVWK
jgi:hypothetical protein